MMKTDLNTNNIDEAVTQHILLIQIRNKKQVFSKNQIPN